MVSVVCEVPDCANALDVECLNISVEGVAVEFALAHPRSGVDEESIGSDCLFSSAMCRESCIYNIPHATGSTCRFRRHYVDVVGNNNRTPSERTVAIVCYFNFYFVRNVWESRYLKVVGLQFHFGLFHYNEKFLAVILNVHINNVVSVHYKLHNWIVTSNSQREQAVDVGLSIVRAIRHFNIFQRNTVDTYYRT